MEQSSLFFLFYLGRVLGAQAKVDVWCVLSWPMRGNLGVSGLWSESDRDLHDRKGLHIDIRKLEPTSPGANMFNKTDRTFPVFILDWSTNRVPEVRTNALDWNCLLTSTGRLIASCTSKVLWRRLYSSHNFVHDPLEIRFSFILTLLSGDSLRIVRGPKMSFFKNSSEK